MVVGAAISAPNATALLVNRSSPDFQQVIERLGGATKIIAVAKTDVWGNIRIPYLEMVPGYRNETPHAWVDVPSDETIV